MTRPPIAKVAALALSVAFVCAGCKREPSSSHRDLPASQSEASPGFPVQVRDDLGRTVVVASRPRRILCLLPSATETVFALGAGDRIVGVDDFSDYPEAATQLPKLGGLFDTGIEQALALKPDLVFVSEHSAAVTALGRGGAAVWAGGAQKFEDVFRVIELTGALLGRVPEATALVGEMRRQIAATEAELQGLPLVSVYYELDPTPYTVGPSSFIGVLISKARGLNIVPEALGEFPRISPELVVSSNPSVIVGASLSDVRRRPGWDRIKAVRDEHVYTWSGAEAHLLSRPGPRLPEGLRALARKLHPSP